MTDFDFTSITRETFVRWGEQIKGQAVEEAVTTSLKEIQTQTDEREQRENWRANKRNFNRMMTLMFALIIGLCVTFLLTSTTGHALLTGLGLAPSTIKMLSPYTFIITILLDSGLALYGYIRKY